MQEDVMEPESTDYEVCNLSCRTPILTYSPYSLYSPSSPFSFGPGSALHYSRIDYEVFFFFFLPSALLFQYHPMISPTTFLLQMPLGSKVLSYCLESCNVLREKSDDWFVATE